VPDPKTGSIERVHVDTVVPYWRNPRRLSEEAVGAVRKSIEQYGYSQPIVVDEKYTIIIGHTRYAAMRSLGATEVDVMKIDYLSGNQVKQLRVIDNRANEYAFWDFEKLVTELEGADDTYLRALFPDIIGADADLEENSVTVRDGSGGNDWDDVDTEVEFVCPMCFHEWIQQVTREQVMSGIIMPDEANTPESV
jgi:hypothetical protein